MRSKLHRFFPKWGSFLLLIGLLISACNSDQPIAPDTSITPVEAGDFVETAVSTTGVFTDTPDPNLPPVPTLALPDTESQSVDSAYPGPETFTATSLPENYPGSTTATPSSNPNPQTPPVHSNSGDNTIYMPISSSQEAPAMPLVPTATPVPALDFAAIRKDLQAKGQDLGFVKMGFHVTLHEDRDILDEWMQNLDAAGVPLFIKTVDNAEPLYRAQELMKISGVPHTLVYRSTGGVPFYELPPQQAAQLHWEEHRDKFPPELDPGLVWIETLNEVDRTRAEWFGQFALETARLAMADGFRWAAFGWASGEPEPEQWQEPSMLAFLQLAGENPDRLAIALHEYSYIKSDIAHEYPYKVGRFQELLRIADANGIPRPTILITEWGWEYADSPSKNDAMRDIAWASELMAAYPQVKGAAIWNLGQGCCYENISDQVGELITPLMLYALNTYFPISQEKTVVDPERFRP